MLNVLAGGIPEGDGLLASLLRDPELGPVALLVQKLDRNPDEVSPEEAAWLMAGSILMPRIWLCGIVSRQER